MNNKEILSSVLFLVAFLMLFIASGEPRKDLWIWPNIIFGIIGGVLAIVSIYLMRKNRHE